MANDKIEPAKTLTESAEGVIEEKKPVASATAENETENPSAVVDERDVVIGDLNEKIIQKDAVIEDQWKIIEKLTEQLKGYVQGSISITSDEPKKPSIPTDSVEIDGVEYGFLKPMFHIHGTTYTAEQAMSNAGVLKAVLAINGQNILRELV